MTKFLILWEADTSKLPDEPKSLIEKLTLLVNMVEEEIAKEGWGLFVGGGAGYFLFEGTEQDLHMRCLKFRPYLKFKAFPVISKDQVKENLKNIKV